MPIRCPLASSILNAFGDLSTQLRCKLAWLCWLSWRVVGISCKLEVTPFSIARDGVQHWWRGWGCLPDVAESLPNVFRLSDSICTDFFLRNSASLYVYVCLNSLRPASHESVFHALRCIPSRGFRIKFLWYKMLLDMLCLAIELGLYLSGDKQAVFSESK